MTALAWLIPVALILGGLGLGAFLWALKTGQFEDMDGAAYRALDMTPFHVDRIAAGKPLIEKAVI